MQPAEAKHAADIVPLMHALGYDTSRETIKTQLDDYKSSDRSIVFIALINTKLVGLVSGHLIPALHQPGNIGRITSLVVAEEYRLMGIASRLTEEVEGWFLGKNCLRFEVTSGAHRDSAHRFYGSRGYSPSDTRFLKIPQSNRK